MLVMDEPSSNLDASSILDLRAILAFWKSQGKTIIVSEHRLYYLRGLADRFIYITGGKVEKDYSVAEFESLTEQQRAKLGLRTFILEDLFAAEKHCPRPVSKWNFTISALPTKTNRKRCTSGKVKSPQIVLSGSSGIMELESPPSPGVSAALKSAAVR